MELFDKKFVHFLWDDSLEDKEGFFADDVNALQIRVNENNVKFYGKACKAESVSYPIAIVRDNEHIDDRDTAYRFFYHDPNYAVKKAFAEGKQIQYFRIDDSMWQDCVGIPVWHEQTKYRIKTMRMTYRELAEWLAKGNGEFRPNQTSGMAYTTSNYRYDCTPDIIPIDYKIRRWGSDEWIEPTVDVYEEDCTPAEAVDESYKDDCKEETNERQKS